MIIYIFHHILDNLKFCRTLRGPTDVGSAVCDIIYIINVRGIMMLLQMFCYFVICCYHFFYCFFFFFFFLSIFWLLLFSCVYVVERKQMRKKC